MVFFCILDLDVLSSFGRSRWQRSSSSESTKRCIRENYESPRQKKYDLGRIVLRGWRHGSAASSHRAERRFQQSPTPRRGSVIAQRCSSDSPIVTVSASALMAAQAPEPEGVPAPARPYQHTLAQKTLLRQARFHDVKPLPICGAGTSSPAGNTRNPRRNSETLTPKEAHARTLAAQEAALKQYHEDLRRK